MIVDRRAWSVFIHYQLVLGASTIMYAIFLYMLCTSSGHSIHIDYYYEDYLDPEVGVNLKTQYEANPLPNSTVNHTNQPDIGN